MGSHHDLHPTLLSLDQPGILWASEHVAVQNWKPIVGELPQKRIKNKEGKGSRVAVRVSCKHLVVGIKATRMFASSPCARGAAGADRQFCCETSAISPPVLRSLQEWIPPDFWHSDGSFF